MGHVREVEQFAALLRALKDRSGVSFEALSRRAGVSRSSLHRYCSGAKIPGDYKTARAVAAACGATGEELRELHRLWVLADAARSGAASSPDPDPDPALSPAPTPPGPEGAPSAESPDGPREESSPVSGGRHRLRWPLTVLTVLATIAAVAVVWRAWAGPDWTANVDASAGTPAIADIRVFNIERGCQNRRDRFHACSLGLARDPRQKYNASNVVSHRVWHDDVLRADCVIHDGERVNDERGVSSTRWYRVRLTDVPGGAAWLPAVRSAESPALPVCD